MEARSPRLPLSSGKYQSSCIWGLVDMFDFRTGRTNQKLLSNGKTRQKRGFEADHFRKADTLIEKCQDIEDDAGLGNHAVNACKTNAEDIMQEEYPSEKQTQKLIKAMKQYRRKSDSAADQNKASKTSKKASKVLADHRKGKGNDGHHPCSCSEELSLDSHEFTAMLEEICSQIHQDGRFNGDMQRSITPSRYNQHDEMNMQRLQISAKAFIDHIYVKRMYMSKDTISSKTKSFSNASETLQLNKDLFLKLLQDPNSLLMKHIQTLQFPLRENKGVKSFPGSHSSECQSSWTNDHEDSEDCMRIQKRKGNLFWQKLRHQYQTLSRRNTTSVSNAIVVLKPASNCRKNPENVSCQCSALQFQLSLKSKQANNKSTYFSFKDMKRKLKGDGGEREREQQSISMDHLLNQLYRSKNSLKNAQKGICRIISREESTSVNDAMWIGKHPKRKGLISCKGPEVDFNSPKPESKKFNSSSTSCFKHRQADIYMEAKRHLSERFRNLKVDETLPRKPTPRTLRMILSSPDHDYLIARSPKRDTSASVSMQMRFCPYGDIEKGKGVSWPSPQKHNEEAQISPSETFKDAYAIRDDLKPTGYANIFQEKESLLPRNLNIVEVPCEVDQSIESTKLCEDNAYGSSSLADSSEDHQHISLLGPSSCPLAIPALKIADACKYREGHPSPISVLEPFFPEDANSPISTSAKQDQSPPLQPRRIDFDDGSQAESPENPVVNITAPCMNEEEYMSAYVRAVMRASKLNFKELSASSPALLHDLIDTYSSDSVGLFQVDSNHELNIRLDCIHEVLVGVYFCYFGYSPWLSFLKPSIRHTTAEANVVEEVVKEVNYYISQKQGQPTLDQLVGIDMHKFGLWFELRPDAEDIVIQIAEDVLQESLMHTILELQI